MAKAISRVFTKEKETKNKIRFQEVTGDGTEEAVGSLYMTKDAYKEIGEPDGVTVEIKAAS